MKRKIFAGILLTGIVVTSALAQWAVVDAGHILETVANGRTLVNEYNQLITTYKRITDQYNQMITNAKYLTTLNAYRQVVTPWQGMSTTNTYGNTGAWIASVNNGLNTVAAWNTAGLPRMAYGTAMANVPAGQAGRVQANFATLELQDGTANSAMQTLGGIRLHGVQNDRTLAILENDSLSLNPALNTELAVLNKINAANMIAARQASDTNKLLASLTEAQLVEMKAKSDAAASAIAQDIAFRRDGEAALTAVTANSSTEMKNFRMP